MASGDARFCRGQQQSYQGACPLVGHAVADVVVALAGGTGGCHVPEDMVGTY